MPFFSFGLTRNHKIAQWMFCLQGGKLETSWCGFEKEKFVNKLSSKVSEIFVIFWDWGLTQKNKKVRHVPASLFFLLKRPCKVEASQIHWEMTWSAMELVGQDKTIDLVGLAWAFFGKDFIHWKPELMSLVYCIPMANSNLVSWSGNGFYSTMVHCQFGKRDMESDIEWPSSDLLQYLTKTGYTVITFIKRCWL